MIASQPMSHHKRAIGVFSTRTASEQALMDLKNSGFPMAQVSIVAKQSDGQQMDIGGVTVTDRLGNDLVLIEGSDNDIHQAADVLSQRGIQDWGVYNLASA